MAKKKTTKKAAKRPTKKPAKKVAKKTTKKAAKKAQKKGPKRRAKTAKKAASRSISQAQVTVARSPVIAPGHPELKAPQVGEVVPNFTLPSTAGQDFNLSDYQGKKVVLYFYPKDSTPGCTTEGYEFSTLQDEFRRHNTEVFGISRNSLLSHDKFRDQESITVDLLSDPDETACKMFDVIKPKNMYGKQVIGVERSTFLLDEQGRLVKEWRKVKAEGHAKEVLNTIKEIPS